MSAVEYIAGTTLTADQASVTFSNIPANYNDLMIVCNVDTTYTIAASASYFLQFNGDTGTNYSTTWMVGNGSSAGSARNSSQSSLYVGEASGSSNIYAPMVIHVPLYSSSNLFKNALAAHAQPGAFVGTSIGLWRNTSAVTSISLFQGSYNSVAGSTFSLWGVK